ncbi:MAG: histidine phosphatase family protein [bacterium]|nr:histidine phosphatase family protein [bacterium]
MHLGVVKKLRNNYYVLRHGESKANIAGIIVSHPRDGSTATWSLTPIGEDQVRESVRTARARGWLDRDTIIYSSRFSRCRSSAEIAKEILATSGEIVFDNRLGERWFGDWEQTDHANYQKVWDHDKDHPEHSSANVESARGVQMRTTALIIDLEQKYRGKTILLVSHGDPLQILETGFRKISAAKHRQLPHLRTAEVKKLELD